MDGEHSHPDCEGLPSYSPGEQRLHKLKLLETGDILAARVPGGNNIPFLVVTADANSINARAITSQIPLVFDRSTGEALDDPDDHPRRVWRISCVQPLPLEIHQLMLSLDRRMRLGSNGITNPLDEGDKRALLYVGDYFEANAI